MEAEFNNKSLEGAINDNSVQDVISSCIMIPPTNENHVEKAEVQSLFKSWGLSDGICVLLDTWGIRLKKHLEAMELSQIDVFFSNFDNYGYFGDRVLFTSGLKTWRREQGIPMVCDADTISQATSSKIFEWLEKISTSISSMSSSRSASPRPNDEAEYFVPTGVHVLNLLNKQIFGKIK